MHIYMLVWVWVDGGGGEGIAKSGDILVSIIAQYLDKVVTKKQKWG
jgi:hypothetical protein